MIQIYKMDSLETFPVQIHQVKEFKRIQLFIEHKPHQTTNHHLNE